MVEYKIIGASEVTALCNEPSVEFNLVKYQELLNSQAAEGWRLIREDSDKIILEREIHEEVTIQDATDKTKVEIRRKNENGTSGD
jgi:hypothetical protein